MSLLFIANREAGYKLSTVTISKLYMDFIEMGYMDTNCFIYDSEGILNYLGVKCRYNNRHDPPKYKCKSSEIEILCLKYSTYKHFVVGNGFGHIAYNPMGKTASGSYLHSKRIFKLL